MSVSARVLVRSERAPSTIFLGLDVRKESVTSTVLPIDATAPTHVDRLAHDRQTLRRSLERRGPAATLQACYEASGAGYVLQRQLATWGLAAVAATAL